MDEKQADLVSRLPLPIRRSATYLATPSRRLLAALETVLLLLPRGEGEHGAESLVRDDASRVGMVSVLTASADPGVALSEQTDLRGRGVDVEIGVLVDIAVAALLDDDTLASNVSACSLSAAVELDPRSRFG